MLVSPPSPAAVSRPCQARKYTWDRGCEGRVPSSGGGRGRVPVDELVNRLRAEVGQGAVAVEDTGGTASYFPSQPDWFDRTRVVATIDERERGASDPDTMAITKVLPIAARLQQGEILELITTFLPAPGIDVMKGKGYSVWSMQVEPELIRTYLTNPTAE